MQTSRIIGLALLLVVGCSPRTRPGDVVSCTPGTMVEFGCSDDLGRHCAGDPTLTVCDGSTIPDDCVTGAPTFIASDQNGGTDSCPVTGALCPASGRLTVQPSGPASDGWVCAWTSRDTALVDRPAATLSCTPGAMLAAGCDGTIGDLCRGDPTIRVCEGAVTPAQCTSSTELTSDDDTGTDRCPLADFTCPPSGSITVVPGGYGGASPAQWDCRWDVGVPGI